MVEIGGTKNLKFKLCKKHANWTNL